MCFAAASGGPLQKRITGWDSLRTDVFQRLEGYSSVMSTTTFFFSKASWK